MKISTIEQTKKFLIDNGVTIEKTNWQGRYRVISKDGDLWQTVRFANAKHCNPCTVKILKYDFNGNEMWMPETAAELVKSLTL